ncbi:MAG TPA: VWA domain-containing protein [Thermoanaerobaculia bacterium]|nr:VWA domain-containing protein [Thermoanaerobaculia bacterium]
MRTAGAWAAALLLSAAAAAQEPADRRGEVHEEALVERVIVDAHVTGRDGTPIPDLGPNDFVVKVDGKPVALESVDWVPRGTPEVDPRATSEAAPSADGAPEPQAPDAAPGRLIVMFFQTDHEISRLHGLLRMGIQARRFLETLDPTDRVAVVSYDSHLKLRQDFTADRAKLDQAVYEAIRRGDAWLPDPDSHPSLGKRMDPDEARRCATPERALEIVARALKPIPGGKSMLFFGWGLGTVGGLTGPNASEQKAWSDAMLRMAEARVNIFSLDITDADYHSLEGSIRQIADLTGGHYEKTNLFPELVMDRIGRAISGRYVLVFVKPHGPRGEHAIDVSLAGGRKGRVFARQYYVD